MSMFVSLYVDPDGPCEITCDHQLNERRPEGYPVLSIGTLTVFPGRERLERLVAVCSAYLAAHGDKDDDGEDPVLGCPNCGNTTFIPGGNLEYFQCKKCGAISARREMISPVPDGSADKAVSGPAVEARFIVRDGGRVFSRDGRPVLFEDRAEAALAAEIFRPDGPDGSADRAGGPEATVECPNCNGKCAVLSPTGEYSDCWACDNSGRVVPIESLESMALEELKSDLTEAAQEVGIDPDGLTDGEVIRALVGRIQQATPAGITPMPAEASMDAAGQEMIRRLNLFEARRAEARTGAAVDADELPAGMAAEWGSPTVEELEAAGRDRPAGVP